MMMISAPSAPNDTTLSISNGRQHVSDSWPVTSLFGTNHIVVHCAGESKRRARSERIRGGTLRRTSVCEVSC